MPLEPTDVPSRQGINDAIDEAVFDHADPADPDGPHYDSGWITLPLAIGAPTGGETPEYRRIGKIVHLRGRMAFPSIGTGNTVVANLPAGFRPSKLTMWARAENSATNNGRLWVATNGAVTISPQAATTSTSVACTFMVD